MKIFKVVVLMFFLTVGAHAQVGILMGGNILKGFGVPGPWGGVHLGLEIPRDDAVSIYGRISHDFSKANPDSLYAFAIARDAFTTPVAISVNGAARMNYTILEGGTRYYLGNGYDFGWAAYGGSNLMLIFNSVKVDYDGFDQALYELDDDWDSRGTIVSFGFGLGGGVKYSIENIGTVYMDMNFSYILIPISSNYTADTQLNQQYGLFRPLLFNFNLGFRKDLIW